MLELEDRVLRIDGVSVVDATKIPELLLQEIPISKMRVWAEDDDVNKFNQKSLEKISSDVCDIRFYTFEDFKFKMPEYYQNVNVEDVLFDKLQNMCLKDDTYTTYLNRLQYELQLFTTGNMLDFVKCLLYVLDVFKTNNVKYGIGRGSSCASLILFLIGLHKIDPIKHEIDISEFIHD